MARSSGWTCQRQAAGAVCKHRNGSRKRTCQRCGKPRPARKRPAHMAALDLSYADYVAINGGDFCALCFREPSEIRRLDRDHSHVSGKPRGILCHRCNRALSVWVTPEWLRRAADYLERTE